MMPWKPYSIPVSVDKLMSGKDSRCDTQESVRQNIRLMLATLFNEHASLENYGSLLKKYDFSLGALDRNQRKWDDQLKKEIQNSLVKSLQAYEPRLTPSREALNEDLVQVLLLSERTFQATKKIIKIKISGRVDHSNFVMEEVIYLS